ncbi:PIG-L deacetylase family protein [Melioribacteraceae bacterium 4301-Me]|uniref:PIG-L deacetylase family protein n=1 Tax=Pyranulibacter aquaticus TaxID=3163344 RepID=UPI00359885CF
MRILYIYPHPDDESFGTAHVMNKQQREGHEVFLLTLTKGGATKQRFKLNLSIEEMGEIRYKEMQKVEKVLKLSGMTVLDFPDSGLKELDPRILENAIKDEITKTKPEVIVTYAVHGISGFHDHLVTHAVVKRAFVELKERYLYLKRLAFHTLTEDAAKKSTYFHLSWSTTEEIDCVITVDNQDLDAALNALSCYETYQETISRTKIKELLGNKCVFEIFNETFHPPLEDLFTGIN